MIKAYIDSEILDMILQIEKCKDILERTKIPVVLSNKFRKNSRKVSSYSSNKIEGNPLTKEQAFKAINDEGRHFLKPEQEIRNYYNALGILEKKAERKEKITKKMILEIQAEIVKGESKEKIGFRGSMPTGVIFAVYDSVSRKVEYIPPEYKDIDYLIDELVLYLETTSDHPLIKAAILHYQLVTIHPFEDGNGRTARILSNYLLECYGYGFKSIGSLEEYYSYDIAEYYSSLQMGLPVLYYDGRENPPHSEIWIKYFLRMFVLYTKKVVEIATKSSLTIDVEMQGLSEKAINFYKFLHDNSIKEVVPTSIAKKIGVTNRTIINWCAELARKGFMKPNLVSKRIRSWQVY